MLVLLLGLHWALLQAAAWTGMVIRYSREAGLRSAIAMTFDGRHPCRLCLAIRAGRTAEQDPAANQFVSSLKLEAVPVPSALAPSHSRPGWAHPGLELRAVGRPDSPPKPPPRGCDPAAGSGWWTS